MGSQKATKSFALTVRRHVACVHWLERDEGNKVRCVPISSAQIENTCCQAVPIHSWTYFLTSLFSLSWLWALQPKPGGEMSATRLSISTFSLKWEKEFCSPPSFSSFYSYLLCVIEFASQELLYDRM